MRISSLITMLKHRNNNETISQTAIKVAITHTCYRLLNIGQQIYELLEKKLKKNYYYKEDYNKLISKKLILILLLPRRHFKDRMKLVGRGGSRPFVKIFVKGMPSSWLLQANDVDEVLHRRSSSTSGVADFYATTTKQTEVYDFY